MAGREEKNCLLSVVLNMILVVSHFSDLLT